MPSSAEPTPQQKVTDVPILLPPEQENPIHKQILLTYIETGTLPEGWVENKRYNAGRADSRNIALENNKTRIVINGGRYRVREGETEVWQNLPVNPTAIHKPESDDGLGGKKPMGGLTFIEPDGTTTAYPSEQPKGAFWPETLESKIATTQRAQEIAKEHKIDVIVPQFTAAHVFTVQEQQVAAGVYEIPRCILYSDYMPVRQHVFGARYAQYLAIGGYVRAGFIHPQLHANNRAIYSTPQREIIPVILDWEDAYDITEYSEELTTDLEIGGDIVAIPASPKEKAEFFSLAGATKADFFEVFNEPAETVQELTDAIADKYLSPMLLGYLGITKEDNVDLDKLEEQFRKASSTMFPDGEHDFFWIAEQFAEKSMLFNALLRLDKCELEKDFIPVLQALQKEIVQFHTLLGVNAAMAMVLMKREEIPHAE